MDDATTTPDATSRQQPPDGVLPAALVVVAHPDDETFGTGSVIAGLAAAGHPVVVCSATRGGAGERPAWLADDASLAEVREAELRSAGSLLGVSRFVVWDYEDSGMDGEPAPGTLVAADPEELNDKVATLLAEVEPGVVVTLDPDHGDGHRDHVAIGRATTSACSDRPSLPLYYWAIPRPLLQRWFDRIAQIRPESGHLDLDHAGLGRPDDHVTTTLDATGVRELRERAIALHASQVSPYEGMPEDLRSDFLDTDRLVKAQPRPTGAEHRLEVVAT